ncbi:hypothetical protein CJ739_1747 [Mariniflexile rhizosphaerae]|uniref:hypothetical protein n=1 Tax=unclassified Mariniflexile TaxID=2643887 RepID=UPI000E33385A|nr:hypothetical protein [Mariniflexile sp. TRM1-10]AXP80833.1 hypothetical protein CJ739_1747 [Mariniflexile sp. TRM1-10]
MKRQKVKAGALQLTMFIVVVVAVLLAAFIILVHTHKQFKIKTDFVLETIENANKGISYVLQNDIRQNDTLQINQQDEDYKTVKVHRDYWGLFEKATAMSRIKTHTFIKTALIGARQPRPEGIALYVEDQNKPLVVVGNTKIQGLAHIPKQGVRTGNISGHSYYGSQLIYGTTRTSAEFPEISKATQEQINTIQDNIDQIEPSQFLDLGKTKKQQNSFLNPLQVLYSSRDITLSDISLTGHILVQSRTKITVEAPSDLKDVVLVAPIIEIKNNTKGTFQAIATKEIIIGEHCRLDYPSAFVLNEEEDNKNPTENTGHAKETPAIKIGKGSTVKGAIVYLGTTKNHRAQVFIDETVTVTGEIYCNRNLELLGTVHGSVFTSNFVANQSGSSYQNHLYNGSITIEALPREYIGLTLENQKKGVLKWLY